MKQLTLLDKIKYAIQDAISWAAWKTFLWSQRMTEQEYWHRIYLQEKHNLELDE